MKLSLSSFISEERSSSPPFSSSLFASSSSQHATFSSAHHLLSLHPHLPSVTLHTPSGPYVGTRLPTNNGGTQITLPSADFIPFALDDPSGEIIFAATCAGFGWTVDRAKKEGLVKFVGKKSGERGREGRYDYESFALVEVEGELLEGGLEKVKIVGGAYVSSVPFLKSGIPSLTRADLHRAISRPLSLARFPSSSLPLVLLRPLLPPPPHLHQTSSLESLTTQSSQLPSKTTLQEQLTLESSLRTGRRSCSRTRRLGRRS